MVAFIFSLVLLTGIASALTFTAPTFDTTLDPTQEMTVSWTSTANDPSTFNLYVGQIMGGSMVNPVLVQAGVSTASGTFQAPVGTITTYGSNFAFEAQDSTGTVIATSNTFTAAIGQNQVTTSNGMTILVTSLTAPAGGSSTATTAAAGTAASAAASATGSTTGSASGSMASNTGFSTSTTSRSSSSTGSGSGSGTSSASSTSATSSANAQPRLMSSGQLVMGAAGVLAGVVALVA